MHGIAAIAHVWNDQRRTSAIARVIGAAGLGPRAADDVLLIDAHGGTAGKLLAGAAQPEVVAAARRLLTAGAPHVVVSLDVASADATAAGLTCGGRVEVLIQRLDVIPVELWSVLAAGRPAALVTLFGGDSPPMVVQSGGATYGTLGSSELDEIAQAEAEPMLVRPGANLARIGVGPLALVIEAWNPVPQLLIVGTADLAVALTRQVELLGWTATTAVHADAALATIAQLSPADVVVVIDHDPLVATPVLAAALSRGIGYVGALGSRRTQVDRRTHLADAGVRAIDIDRLHGPTGLDLGARTPAETAVSIAAEVIAVRSGRLGTSLAGETGRISG